MILTPRCRIVMGWAVLIVVLDCWGVPAAAPAEPPGRHPAEAADAAAIEPAAEPEIREIALRHRWTGEALTTVYKIDGVYQAEAMAAIDHMLRDWRCNRTIAIDPRLIDLIYELHRDLGAKRPVGIVSGYRSEGHNASLLRAGRTVDPNSQHMYGRAADVVFPGVPLETLKAAARKRSVGGVGAYPFSGPPFLHLDTGPVREWQELSARERRVLKLPRRRRRRLTLDCDLKIADVLRDIPGLELLVALPLGASTGLPAAWFTLAGSAGDGAPDSKDGTPDTTTAVAQP